MQGELAEQAERTGLQHRTGHPPPADSSAHNVRRLLANNV